MSKTSRIIETENIIRPRSIINLNPRIQGAPVSSGFDMQRAPSMYSQNVINTREQSRIRRGTYSLADFEPQYMNYVEPDGLYKGIQSTRLNFK